MAHSTGPRRGPSCSRWRARSRTTGRRPTSTLDGVRWTRSSGTTIVPRPRPAAQAPPEGDRTPARPRVGRPGQFRGAEPDQRLRHRRRDDARPPQRQRLTQRGWSLGDESGAAARVTPTPRWSTTRSRARSRCGTRGTAYPLGGGPLRLHSPWTGARGRRPVDRGAALGASGPGSISRRSRARRTRRCTGSPGASPPARRPRTTPPSASRLYLRSNFEYKQDVPNRTYPLPAFISQDRAGYCQQFSGAMALMLRMLGIPSRVAAGFAPEAVIPTAATI